MDTKNDPHFNDYSIHNRKVEQLIQLSMNKNWNIFSDLPWETQVPLEALAPDGSFCLIQSLPEFKKMSKPQQAEIRQKEIIYHLSNLLAGEHRAILMAAQIIDRCPRDIPDWTYFVSTILIDERNHSMALSRYLQEKVGICYAAHPKIEEILQALAKDSSFESKLFIGQVVLEWTAVSLLSSVTLRSQEPLLGQLVRKILHDEGRHLGFSRIATPILSPGRNGSLPRTFEDLLFEGIVACASSLCSIPVWQEYGLAENACREYALKDMEQKGVLRFYTELLPLELSKYHLSSDRLNHLLKTELTERIIKDHWSFAPTIRKEEPHAEESR